MNGDDVIVHANKILALLILTIPHLADIGSVFISSQCRAPFSDLQQLIVSGGGDLSPGARTARIVVGEPSPANTGQHTVTEKWVLDSVQYHSVMPFSDYPL